MKHFLLMLFVVLWSTVTGQAQLIEGTILDEVSSTGIPYANIYNKTLDIGTISNEDGYFEIRIRSTSDVIEISFIGYEGQTIPLTKGQRTYTILLQEESQLLNEVTITPKDDSYLFNLLFEAKKVANFPNQEAKAYYELKTWRDQKQVELVENYYNLLLRGPDVSGFQLKAGRLALQEEEGRYFGSFGGSNAINLLKLWDRNDFFPNTPIDIAKRRAKRTFYLHLSKKYINADQDSIYVIDYEPQTSDGPYFTGQIWLNKSDMQVLKITQLCDACAVHPFIPLFPTDSLLSVNFDITKTFKSIDGKMVFNHIDFLYDVTYRSRIGYNWEDEFTVSTKAVLYAYDFEHQFYIPSFFLGNKYKGDYRKINGVPYNIFFWDYNDEYGLNDQYQLNQQFYHHPKSVTSEDIFLQNASDKLRKGFFKHPYITWRAGERVEFREVSPDTVSAADFEALDEMLTLFNEKKYNLAIKFFLDVNEYQDSLNFITATIFDPLESFYYLPIDNKARCFINLFFDWCEIERRKFHASIEHEKDPAIIKRKFHQWEAEMVGKKEKLLYTLKEGTNEKAVLNLNQEVLDILYIDNVLLFNPFPEEEEEDDDF